MEGGPDRSRRQSLVDQAVALLSQGVDGLSRAAQGCITAGQLAQARENTAQIGSRLHEVEELLREIEQVDSQKTQSPDVQPAATEPEKRDDRVFRGPGQACGQIYPLRLYRAGWRYRWLCYRCRQTHSPSSAPKSPGT